MSVGNGQCDDGSGRAPARPGHSRAVRVVLVGRTGIDAALRKDPDIELIRVPTALEAVAEAASPADGARRVVVIAPEVEQAFHDDAGAGMGPGADFMKGLKIADPDAVVLGVARNGMAVLTPFDGALSPDLPADALREQLRGLVNGLAHGLPNGLPNGQGGISSPRNPGDAPPPPTLVNTPAEELLNTDVEETEEWSAALGLPAADSPEPAAPAAPAPAATGDHDMVAALVRGRDVLGPAITLIRARTGDETVEFVARGATSPEPARAGGEPVSWEGTLLGHLRSRRAGIVSLAGHARWLAAWLRLRDQQSQLRAAAFTDPLTGAYNRRYFDKFLASAIEQARDARRHLTVMIFDIDDFKKYNDQYGHDAGDEILRETVKMMRSVIRPTDRVCRIGGDEFAVIFYEPQGPRMEGSRHPASVFAIAQRFQQQVHEHKFPKLAGCAAGTLTISGGLATYPWDGATVEELVERADGLSLKSKRQGKNAITFGPRGE